MALQLTSDQVWQEIDKHFFAILGMVTAKGESRTVGVNYVVDDHKLCINTDTKAWKTRHIAANPYVSITNPIFQRVPLLPWIKVPPIITDSVGIPVWQMRFSEKARGHANWSERDRT